MPTYRVRTHDGAERTVQALRVRTDGDRLCLENRAGGLWHPALDVPLEDVERFWRRVSEFNGSWTWVPEPLSRPSSMTGTLSALPS